MVASNDTPVASSSRLRLGQSPPPPPPPPPARRYRRALRRNARVIAFVLVLTAPYLAAASPVPPPHRARGHRTGYDPHSLPTDTPISAPFPYSDPPSTTGYRSASSWTTRIAETALLAGLNILQDTARAAVSISRRETGGNAAAWTQLDIARRTDHGYYRVPDDVVELEQSVNAGFVVLSYLISFVGSMCTLELLIRRTSNRGASNLILLAFAGICFGAVSTFAMHFVGNQSLTLHHPDLEETLALTYSAAYTVLSLVASCLAMTFAFFVMGTDIRWRNWYWPCRGRRERQDARNDYSRWKAQKRAAHRSTNVGTIFQQAGMVASWSLMDNPKMAATKEAPRSWKDIFLATPKAQQQSTMPYMNGDFDNEDQMVKYDKDLGELDFRFGRGAVREEIDRRHLRVGSPTSDALQSPNSSDGGMPAIMSSLPTSPLAAYYPTGGAVRDVAAEPQNLRPPTPPHQVFSPDYQFPPRSPIDTSSTTNLIPRKTEVPPPLPDGIPPGGWNNHNDGTVPLLRAPPPAPFPRRASLPVLQPPPPPRVAQTLARIQSLPEHEHDVELAVQRNSDDSKEQNGHANGGMPMGQDEMAEQSSLSHHVLYEEDHEYVAEKKRGWRKRLRDKIQAGTPLTTWERTQRFFGLDIVTWGGVIKICLTGMFAGWGVAAMHYIGQVSINDIPYTAYRVSYVVGSVIIASGAVIIALYIMFIMLRPKLKHSWTSKTVVAIILAGAVCGMHYTAMKGTIYGWRVGKKPNSSSAISGTKRAITGLVAALAFVACLGVIAFIMINSMRDRKERARRRRVVVASVLLDEHDRMLVSAIDGLLPMCDIASLTTADQPVKSKKRSRSIHDGASSTESSALAVDLTTANEAFVQAVKMSWSWRNPFWSAMNPFSSLTDISPTIPVEEAPLPEQEQDQQQQQSDVPHLQHRGSTVTAADSLASSMVAGNTRLNVARFLEKFAICATQLSVRLTGQNEGIGRLGVLYDQILTTGWVRLRNGKDTVSKGQLIFLVRRVTSEQERSDLLSRHFIFADTTSVATSLHKTLSTPYDHVMPLLEDMRGFCDSTMRMSLRPNTLYAGVVVVQATPFDGLRILLNQKSRSQLPMREVCTFSTLPGLPVNVTDSLAGTLEEIGEAVTWLEGMDLLSVIVRNMAPEAIRVGGPRVGRLLSALERAVVPMLDELLSHDDMAYILPRLTLHPVLVPLTPASPPRKGVPGWVPPHVIVFYANYDVAVNTFADKWLPFKLFRAQHDCVMASKISAITRAAESAANPQRTTPGASSPALSPGLSITSSAADPNRYNYARRPSKVQFEVPPAAPTAGPTVVEAASSFSNYTFPPRDPYAGAWAGASANASPTAVTGGQSFPPPLFSSRDRQPPRRSSLAKSTFRDEAAAPDAIVMTRPGVADYDANWLLTLLRTRLRADA